MSWTNQTSTSNPFSKFQYLLLIIHFLKVVSSYLLCRYSVQFFQCTRVVTPSPLFKKVKRQSMLRRTTHQHTPSSKTPLENVFSKKFMAMSLMRNVSRSVHTSPHSVDEARFLLSAQPLSGAGAERLWGFLNPPTSTATSSLSSDNNNNAQHTTTGPSIGQRYNYNLEDAHLREPLDIIAVDRAVRNDLRRALRGSNGGGEQQGTLLSTYSMPASRRVLVGYNSRADMMAQYLASHSQLRPSTPSSSTKAVTNIFSQKEVGKDEMEKRADPSTTTTSIESTPKVPMTEAELRVVNMAKLAAILAASSGTTDTSASTTSSSTSTPPTSPAAKRVSVEADRAAYNDMVAKYMWLYGRLRPNTSSSSASPANLEAPRPVSPGHEGVHLKPVADRYEGPFPFAAEFLSASPNSYEFSAADETAHSLLVPSTTSERGGKAGAMPRIKHTPSFVIEEKLPESIVAENEDVILVLTATKLEGAHEPLPSSRRVDGVTRCPTRSPRYLIELRLVPQVSNSQTATVPIVVNSLFTVLDCGRRLLRSSMDESNGGGGGSPFEMERSASGEDEMNSRGKGDKEATGESAVQTVSVPSRIHRPYGCI